MNVNVLKYVSSRGDTYDLLASEIKVNKTTSFHDYAWTASEVEQTYGTKVNAFVKEAKTLSIELIWLGTRDERAANMDAARKSSEYDVVNNAAGRIYWNNYYLQGFITESGGYDYGSGWNRNTVTFYAPYPFWIFENKKSFYASTSVNAEDAEYLDYEYDYAYDYLPYPAGASFITNGDYAAANFELIVYGPVVTPAIAIGGHIYQVNTTVSAGEYLVINSKDYTVTRHTVNGTAVNEFNNREKSSDVFAMIQAGLNTVIWSGGFGFDLTLFEERSEPEWS